MKSGRPIPEKNHMLYITLIIVLKIIYPEIVHKILTLVQINELILICKETKLTPVAFYDLSIR